MSKKFEQKLEKAKGILDQLVSEDIDLDSSIKLYKEGMQNLKEAQDLLDKAKLDFEALLDKHQ